VSYSFTYLPASHGPYGGVPSRNPRTTSIAIMVINAAVWAVIQVAGWAGAQSRVVDFLGLMPRGMCALADGSGRFYPAATSALTCAAIPNTDWVPGVADGAWWQLFTSIVTQVTFMHIACNCLTLFFIGPSLEALLGRARFVATYLVAGLFGSVAVYWFASTSSISYGGSGALFGVMGALLVILWRRHGDVRQLLLWIGLNVVMTFLGAGISWQAHLGGLLGGAIVACVWVFVRWSTARGKAQWLCVAGLVLLLAVGFVARTSALA
jgi:membrane associated rhomboid family serine protease